MSLIAQAGGTPQTLNGGIFTDQLSSGLLGANTNDLAVDNFVNATLVSIKSSAAINLTGLAGGRPNEIKFIRNDGDFTITVVANSVLSAAPNRFNLPSNIVLAPGGLIMLMQGLLPLGWFMTFGASSGGGGGSSAPLFNNVVAATPGASVNNFNPTGWNGGLNVSRLALTPTPGGSTLTGLSASGAVDGQAVIVSNQDLTTDSITFSNQSTFSTAANRFAGPGGGDFTLIPGAADIIYYDASLSLWRFL